MVANASPLAPLFGFDASEGRLLGIDATATGEHVATFSSDGVLRSVDSAGRTLRTLLPTTTSGLSPYNDGVPSPRQNVVAVDRHGRVALRDKLAVWILGENGLLLRHLPVAGLDAKHFGDIQLATLSDSQFVTSVTGAVLLDSRDRAVRTRTALVNTPARGAAPSVIGYVDNALSLEAPFDRFPPRSPYRHLYRRTWDASLAGIVVRSWRSYSVCFFATPRRLIGVYRVDAPMLLPTASERQRAVAEYAEIYGDREPGTRRPWSDVFADHWPDLGPHYIDVVVSDAGTALAERLLPSGQRVADVYHVRTGYLGSVKLGDSGFPLGFLGSTPLTMRLSDARIVPLIRVEDLTSAYGPGGSDMEVAPVR